MSDLKLLALDKDDLVIVSSHIQDGVFKLADVDFTAKSGVFSCVMNRFVWEKAAPPPGFWARLFKRAKQPADQRCRTALTVKRVGRVRSTGVDLKNREQVLCLLSIEFQPLSTQVEREGPEGVLTLYCAGSQTIQLEVECIEVQLADLGGAWETTSRPDHVLN